MVASRRVGTCALRTWKKKSNASSATIPRIVSHHTAADTSIGLPHGWPGRRGGCDCSRARTPRRVVPDTAAIPPWDPYGSAAGDRGERRDRARVRRRRSLRRRLSLLLRRPPRRPRRRRDRSGLAAARSAARHGGAGPRLRPRADANRLAARGCRVTGLDSSQPFLDRARTTAGELGVTVDYVHGDMRRLPWTGRFDRVVSWFTAFGYFDDADDRRVLAQAPRRSNQAAGSRSTSTTTPPSSAPTRRQRWSSATATCSSTATGSIC
ncbi:class I SAM-dependent methyltransferase [Nonomuraea sp. NPDC052634]|uniref:class I SAM-dependent methyltransferase n=1 Tax=Nonomuraea sp. NPDC052634 TaxID=3155813 RepID=UPI00342559B9